MEKQNLIILVILILVIFYFFIFKNNTEKFVTLGLNCGKKLISSDGTYCVDNCRDNEFIGKDTRTGKFGCTLKCPSDSPYISSTGNMCKQSCERDEIFNTFTKKCSKCPERMEKSGNSCVNKFAFNFVPMKPQPVQKCGKTDGLDLSGSCKTCPNDTISSNSGMFLSQPRDLCYAQCGQAPTPSIVNNIQIKDNPVAGC